MLLSTTYLPPKGSVFPPMTKEKILYMYEVIRIYAFITNYDVQAPELNVVLLQHIYY